MKKYQGIPIIPNYQDEAVENHRRQSENPGNAGSRIFTVSLNSRTPNKAYAAYTGTQLFIADIMQIGGDMGEWSVALRKEIAEKQARDNIVLIEEKTRLFATNATRFDFEEKSHEGKSQLQTALEYYFAMEYTNSIVFSQNASRFRIHETIVEKIPEEKGRTKFSVDWDKFGGGMRCLLMCVMAALWEPVTDRYMSRFFAEAERLRGAKAGDDGYANMGGLRGILRQFGEGL